MTLLLRRLCYDHHQAPIAIDATSLFVAFLCPTWRKVLLGPFVGYQLQKGDEQENDSPSWPVIAPVERCEWREREEKSSTISFLLAFISHDATAKDVVSKSW